jgi:hypothetical protein
MIRLGLDYHGVCDKFPEIFGALSNMFFNNGNEVHLITGELDTPEFRLKLETLGIKYTHLFSISTHHISKGSVVWIEDGKPYMDKGIWDRTKAEYCKENKIDLHIDDTPEYGDHFQTPFLLLRKDK